MQSADRKSKAQRQWAMMKFSRLPCPFSYSERRQPRSCFGMGALLSWDLKDGDSGGDERCLMAHLEGGNGLGKISNQKRMQCERAPAMIDLQVESTESTDIPPG